MGRRIAQALVVASVVGIGVVPVARAGSTCDPSAPSVVAPNPRRVQVTFDWDDDVVEQSVRFRSRTCADLAGTLYAPKVLPARRLPGVLVLPPSGGVADESQVAYVARTLASNGYIAMTADPQGLGDSGLLSDPACATSPGYSNPSPCPGVPFQTMDNWMELARSSLDFFLGADDPLRSHIDARHVGAVGHSLGARASSYLQDPFFDGAGSVRIAATVGLDNISSNYYGDSSAGGGNSAANDAVVGQPLPGDHPIAISVPGLGLASDGTNADPDFKKFAFDRWRDAGVPTGMLVFAGVAHGDFSQSASSDETTLHRFAYYTLAWFDRWLKNDRSATDRLLAPTVLGVDVASTLSTTQHSAWYLPTYGTDDYRSALSSA